MLSICTRRPVAGRTRLSPALLLAPLIAVALGWLPLSASANATLDALIELNHATAAELAAALPGIGPVKAAAIIAMRQRIGAFRSVEELLDVPGIGPKTLAAIRDRLRIDAAAASDAAAIDADTQAVRAIVEAARQAEPHMR